MAYYSNFDFLNVWYLSVKGDADDIEIENNVTFSNVLKNSRNSELKNKFNR